MRKQFLKVRTLGIFLSLSLLCLSAAADLIEPLLSVDAAMNKSAGRGGFVFVPLRLENGEELPFMVDTGSPITVFDKTLEPKLGKRIKSGTMSMGWTKQKCGVYAAPKLYFGNTLLITGSNILTYDFKQAERHAGYLGILGMDCMKHYCIQLDFEAGKVRFLDFEQLDHTNLGDVFPLTFQGGHIYLEHAGLLGGSNTNSLIDTGWNIDGRVEKASLKYSGKGHLPECVWNGEVYTNLNVQFGENANMLGLRFLARHLVTFDFPNNRIFLKQTSVGPLAAQNPEQNVHP